MEWKCLPETENRKWEIQSWKMKQKEMISSSIISIGWLWLTTKLLKSRNCNCLRVEVVKGTLIVCQHTFHWDIFGSPPLIATVLDLRYKDHYFTEKLTAQESSAPDEGQASSLSDMFCEILQVSASNNNNRLDILFWLPMWLWVDFIFLK